MAPISLRPALSRAISVPISKSSRCTRIISASGDGREEGDLTRAGNPRIMAHVTVIDRGADNFGASEGILEFRPAALQPIDQLGDGGDTLRRRDLLRGDAGLLLDPGEIEETHPATPPSSHDGRRP